MVYRAILDKLAPFLNSGLIGRLMRENFRQQAPVYGKAIICMALVAGMTTASAWIMRDLTDSSVLSKDFDRVLVIAGMVAAIFITKGFATYFQTIFLSRAGNAIIADQQVKIYDRLIEQDVNFFSRNASSDLVIRVTHNAQAARQVIDILVTGFVRDLFSLIGLVAVMIYQLPFVAITVFIAGPIAILSVRSLLNKVRHLMEQELQSLAMIVQAMQETIVGIGVIKTFSLEKLMRKRMEKAVRDVENRANSIVRLEAATSPIMETIGGVSVAGLLALSTYLVIHSDLTPGELMSFVTAMLLAYEPAKRLARMRVSIETGLIGVRMMFEIMDRPIQLVEKPDAVPLPQGPGEIAFESVGFTYTPDVPVIREVSFVFPPGKTTALVGPSGGGKSTIIKLIMRMYEPDEGRVLIDGTDICDATFASLRERIAFVGQDTFLFSGSVAFNIGLGRPEASRDEIIEAAKVANAHDFIMAMPDGYDAPVGENGRNLSGGQRQRIAIARAVLKDSDILILDEATSALDSHSESAVRDAIEHAARGRTTIMIAHRLSTIAKADVVAYVEEGRIIETGTQAELLRLKGAYWKLYEKQELQAAS